MDYFDGSYFDGSYFDTATTISSGGGAQGGHRVVHTYVLETVANHTANNEDAEIVLLL